MKKEIQGRKIVTDTAVAYGQSKNTGLYALAAAVNTLWAEGVADISVKASVCVPPYVYKSRRNGMMKLLQETCQEYGICLEEEEGLTAAVVTVPEVIVTGTGITEEGSKEGSRPEILPGWGIVQTGWLGMSGMLQVAEERKQELSGWFSPSFMKQILFYQKELFAKSVLEAAGLWKTKEGGKVSFVRQIGSGGILAELWNLSKETKLGLDMNMKAFSILQETVEVCEYFRLNPYQLSSVGSFLMVSEDAEGLAEQILAAGGKANVIGSLTDSHDKLIRNGEEIRYLDRPAPDELWKIYQTDPV